MPACSEGQKQKPRQKLTRIFLRLPRGKRYDRNDPRRQPERLPKRNRMRLRSLRKKEADPQRNTRKHKESNGMTPETLDKWKIVPRIMLFVMTGVYIRCIEYAISLGADMTTQQASLISVVTGAMTGSLAVFLNSEAKREDTKK